MSRGVEGIEEGFEEPVAVAIEKDVKKSGRETK